MAISRVNTINPKQDTNFRDNFCAGAIGVNKTGKSSTIKSYCQIIKDSRPTNHIFAGHDPQKMFRDLIKPNHLINMEDKEWALKLCEYRNCTIILDEIKLLCSNPQHPPKGMLTLFSNYWYWNMDIFWMAHNPLAVPDQCTYFTKLYFIFCAYIRRGQFERKIPNPTLCIAASNMVNKYVEVHGRGRHKKDKLYDGQGFPYAIVDIEQQRIKAINMNKAK